MATNQEIRDFYGGLAQVTETTLDAHRELGEAKVEDDEVAEDHDRYDTLVILATGSSLETGGLFNSRTEEERVADVMEKFVTTGKDGKSLDSLADVYDQFLLNIQGMTSNMDGTIL